MIIEARVSTNSKNPGIEESQGFLKIRVKAKPVEGKANSEVIKKVAEHYGVKECSVRIIKGAASRKKIIELKN